MGIAANMVYGDDEPLSPQLLDLGDENAEDTVENDLNRLKQVKQRPSAVRSANFFRLICFQ